MSISLESGTLHSRVIQLLERMLRGPWALSWLTAICDSFLMGYEEILRQH